MDLSPGTRLDRYELLEPIGSGGQGMVWRVRDLLAPDEPRAVKLVDVAQSGPEQLERVRREARQLSRLEHPSIVGCHGLFEDVHRELLGIVTTFVDGAPLSDLMSSGSGLDSGHHLAALRHIADALAYVHSKGVIHRDLKPANVLTRAGFLENPEDPQSVQLIDFGIAFGLDVGDKLTKIGFTLGTPPYMAPETLDPLWGVMEPRPSLDVFAFGVLAWQLLIGGHPTGLSGRAEPAGYAVAYREMEANPGEWLAAIRGGPYEGWLAECLVLEPNRRLKTGADIVRRIARREGNTLVDSPYGDEMQPGPSNVSSETETRVASPGQSQPTPQNALDVASQNSQPSSPSQPEETRQAVSTLASEGYPTPSLSPSQATRQDVSEAVSAVSYQPPSPPQLQPTRQDVGNSPETGSQTPTAPLSQQASPPRAPTVPGLPPDNLPTLISDGSPAMAVNAGSSAAGLTASAPTRTASPWPWVGVGLGILAVLGVVAVAVFVVVVYFYGDPESEGAAGPEAASVVASCTGKQPLGLEDVYDLQVSGLAVKRGRRLNTNDSYGRKPEGMCVVGVRDKQRVCSVSGGKLRVKVGDLVSSGQGLNVEMLNNGTVVAVFRGVRMASSQLLCSNKNGYAMPLTHSEADAKRVGVQARKFTFFLRPIDGP